MWLKWRIILNTRCTKPQRSCAMCPQYIWVSSATHTLYIWVSCAMYTLYVWIPCNVHGRVDIGLYCVLSICGYRLLHIHYIYGCRVLCIRCMYGYRVMCMGGSILDSSIESALNCLNYFKSRTLTCSGARPGMITLEREARGQLWKVMSRYSHQHVQIAKINHRLSIVPTILPVSAITSRNNSICFPRINWRTSRAWSTGT